MESLFLHGKARLFEDALTASLADLLVALNSPHLLTEILSGAYRVNRVGRLTGHHLELLVAWDQFAIDLWPNWPEGEPDAVIWLYCGAERVGGVVVEAKYGASKSGEYTEEAPQLVDQLGRYASGLRGQLGPSRFLEVVYLTPHNAPPVAELEGSWRAISEKTDLEPGRTLSWLPWIHVDRSLLSFMREERSLHDVETRLIARVRALLARARLRTFGGWCVEIGFGRHPGRPRGSLCWLEEVQGTAPSGFSGWRRDDAYWGGAVPPPARWRSIPLAPDGVGIATWPGWSRADLPTCVGSVTGEFPWEIK